MTSPLVQPDNDTVRAALAAHGGLDRWSGVAFVTAQVELDGIVWEAKTRDNPSDMRA
jgi:hypothetical protein